MNRTALDQYEGLVTDALKSCSAKLRTTHDFVYGTAKKD